MMRWLFTLLLASVSVVAFADASPGRVAPAFSLRDTTGKEVALADFRGRVVVLEWVNPMCPFVRKHYGSQNMQSLQKRAAASDVVWLSIQSTHPEHSDYHAPAQLAGHLKDVGAAPSAVLMDDDGRVGRLYGARTTPQMFVVDAAGVLRYAGAIDDRRSANPEDVRGARNHVAAALDEIKAGRAVSVAATTPYGCSVKYR
jgi:peroxiredoxin